MGRRQSWTPENQAEWRTLRDDEAFKSIQRICTKGIRKVEHSDLDALVSASPHLSPTDSLADLRKAVRGRVAQIPEPERRKALLVLFRATDESRSMPVEATLRLARVKLGEANPHRAAVAKKKGIQESAVADLQLVEGLPTGNDTFRRVPKGSHAPGEYFLLLRDIYEELVPVDTAKFARGPLPAVEHVPPTLVPISEPQPEHIDVLRRIANEHYGTDLELTQFAKVFLNEHELIEGLSMDVALSDHSDDFYLYSVVRHFRARFKTYTAGVVLGDTARAALSRAVPELRDLIWLPLETPDLDKAVTELIRAGLLEIRDRSGASGYRSARFEPLSNPDLDQRLEDAESLDSDLYRLLGVQVTDQSELLEYRSTLHMRLARKRRRCGWFVDGPTYVERITIDLSGFADAATSDHANVQFYLPGSDNYASPEELDQRRFERTVRDWAVRHHGYAIHW